MDGGSFPPSLLLSINVAIKINKPSRRRRAKAVPSISKVARMLGVWADGIHHLLRCVSRKLDGKHGVADTPVWGAGVLNGTSTAYQMPTPSRLVFLIVIGVERGDSTGVTNG